MIESCRKVSRGQVWFLVDNDAPAVLHDDHLQAKNRPWLVVSNNHCNQSSPIYTVVPFTTAPKNRLLPTHVIFQTGDKEQTILCEQIRSINQKVFFNSGSHYMYTMSEKYMAMVDEALAVQLGISLTFPNSERFWESLEKLIRVRVKQAVADSKVDAIDVSKLSTLIDAKVESLVNGEDNAEKVEPTADIPEEQPQLPLEEKKTFVPITKPKRRKWTYDEKRDFLDYYANNGAQKTAEEYDMEVANVYASRARFIKELEEQK